MTPLTITLPWPDRLLHPNARPNRWAKAAAVKAARRHAHLLALEAGWHLVQLPPGRLDVWLDFYPPNLSRKRDDDGLLSSMKSARDGLADALKVDDSRFKSHPDVKDVAFPGGKVDIRITGAPNE